MGRKALTAGVWLISAWTVTCLGIRDNVSAESAPRLYRNVNGIYASAFANAAPFGAFSFQAPAVLPAAKATQLIPLKQESIVIQNSNGFLKDSYGNKFVETPTSAAYKTTFPQQFVQLQHLPAHLAQPLTATPSYHFAQGPPQAFFGTQFRLPSLDAVSSPITRYGAFAQPFAYAGNVKSLTPGSDQQFQFVTPAKAQQDSSNNKVVYATQGYNQLQNEPKFQRLEDSSNNKVVYTTQGYNQLQNEPKFQRLEAPSNNKVVYTTQGYNQVQNEPKFQRLEQNAPQNEYYEALRQQAAPSLKAKVQAPVRHTVTTTHNGKDTVVQIETKPPLPLLDLSLLEPLTFANPVVPQVQHYLPKISAVTYSKLHPQDDAEEKNEEELVIEKTKSYDTGVVKGKAYSDDTKKKQKNPPKKDADVYINFESESEKPSIKVKGNPNDPGYSYEINSPGYKETFNQQVVKYDKETQNDPVTYTYEKQTQKKPVTYSYSHSSKDPGHTKIMQFVKKDPEPGHLVYHFQPEQGAKHNESPGPAPEESDDSNESSEADDDSPAYDHAQYVTQAHHDKPHQDKPYHDKPHHNKPYHDKPHHDKAHHDKTYHHKPHHDKHHHEKPHHDKHHHEKPHHDKPYHDKPHHDTPHHDTPHHAKSQSYQYHPSHSEKSHPSTHSHHGHLSSHAHSSPHSHSSSTSHPSTSYHPQSTTSHHSHATPSHHLKAEHRGQINHNPTPSYYVVSHKPQYYTHSPLAATPKLTPLHEYAENLRFIPSHTNAAIRVDPGQPQSQHPKPQYFIQQTTPHARSEGAVVSEPVIYEKSKKIIIQEESPDEMHSHQEKLTAQMETVGQDENNEEDFEKSYKEAAYGFPAYDRDSAESEEEIYGHNYGEPRQDSGVDKGEGNSPFEQYTEEGDQFPKSARLSYRDGRDKVQEDYFLGYSLNKPEIMTDRHQSKLNYYKMFLKNKPEKLRASDAKKKTSKYTVEPSFFDSPPKQKQKQSAQYKTAPIYEYSYDYDKEARDNSAYASRPLQYKSKTLFVEPQFQYGFEPIAIPRLDSEQETMASNVSPESEKPGTRKKVYKENWYIKKTTTSSKPS